MPTARRTLIFALLLVAAAGSLIFTTGAAVVDDGPADTFADDDLAVQPADGPNGNYAYLNDDDEIVWSTSPRRTRTSGPTSRASTPTRSRRRTAASSRSPTPPTSMRASGSTTPARTSRSPPTASRSRGGTTTSRSRRTSRSRSSALARRARRKSPGHSWAPTSSRSAGRSRSPSRFHLHRISRPETAVRQ